MAISLGNAYGSVGIDATGVRTGVSSALSAWRSLITGFREGASQARDEMSRTEGAVTGLGDRITLMKGSAMVALGNLASQGFSALTAAAGNALAEGIKNVASYEKLRFALTALTAREIYRAGIQEKTVAIGVRAAQVTDKQVASTKDLSLKQQELSQKITAAQHDIDGYAYKISQIKAGKAKGDIVQLEDAINAKRLAIQRDNLEMDKANEKLGKLTEAASATTTIYKTVATETITLADARRMASERLKDELAFVQKLAILSPFTNEQAANAYKTLKVYGFVTAEAQRMTQSLTDFAAGNGLAGDSIAELAYPLGVMAQENRINAHYLRQLQVRGMEIEPTMKRFGVTLDSVAESGVNAKDFIKDLLEESDKFFKGTASEQAGTFSGLISSLLDLKQIAERNVFTPFFESLRPALQGFVDALQGDGVTTLLQMFGKALGWVASGPLRLLKSAFGGLRLPLQTFEQSLKLLKDPVLALQNTLRVILPPEIFSGLMKMKGLVDTLKAGLATGLTPTLAMRNALRATFGPEAAATFDSLSLALSKVSGLIGKIKMALAPVGSIVAQSLSSAFGWFTANVLPALNSGLDWLSKNWDKIATAIKIVGGILAGGAIAGALAGIVGALGTINIPFIAIRLALAALAQAWNTDFWGIRTSVLSAWTQIQPALSSLWSWLQTQLPVALQKASVIWNTTLLPALASIATFVATQVVPAIRDIVIWLATNIPAAIQSVSAFWNTTLLPALQAVSTFITTQVVPVFQSIWNWLSVNIPQAIQAASRIWNTILLPALKTVWRFVEEDLLPLFRSIDNVIRAVAGKAIEAFAGLWQTTLLLALKDVGNFINQVVNPALMEIKRIIDEVVVPALRPFIDGVLADLIKGFASVKTIIEDATKFFNELAQKIKDFKLPPVLTPGSPTPFENALRGIAGAMQEINQVGLPKLDGNSYSAAMRGIGASMGAPNLAFASPSSALGASGGANVFSPNIHVLPAPVIVQLDSEEIFRRGFNSPGAVKTAQKSKRRDYR